MWVRPDIKFKPKKPLFLCVLANTETAKIPNISAAGKSPELTDYTPAADAELVVTGNAISISEPAMTPSGSPTPAVITRACLLLTGIPYFFIDSGLNIKPKVPFFDLNVSSGRDIRTGNAVPNVFDIYNKSKSFGKYLSKLSDFVVIGESVPGGTTTALGVMKALGYDGKVSSSFPENPTSLKNKVIEQGMKNAGISFGSLKNNPLYAIKCLGDPMIASVSGLVDGLKNTKIILAGGTQMIAVLSVIKELGLNRDVYIATTKFVANDKTANFKEMVNILGFQEFLADPGFEYSNFEGLKMYETGDVKEGVGAGGSMFLTWLMGFSQKELREKVEEVCFEIFR